MTRGHSLHSKIKSSFKIRLSQEERLPIYLRLINFLIFKKVLGRLLVSNLSTSCGRSQNFLTRNIRLFQTKWRGIICYQNKKPQCWPETMQSLKKKIKIKTDTHTLSRTAFPVCFQYREKSHPFKGQQRISTERGKTPQRLPQNLVKIWLLVTSDYQPLSWGQTLQLCILDPVLDLDHNSS